MVLTGTDARPCVPTAVTRLALMQWTVSREEFANSSVENENSLRRGEIKPRKNEMKLRKNEIEVRKSFSVSHWKIKDFHGGIHDFLRLVHLYHESTLTPRRVFCEEKSTFAHG